jgi:hypothetical protein
MNSEIAVPYQNRKAELLEMGTDFSRRGEHGSG